MADLEASRVKCEDCCQIIIMVTSVQDPSYLTDRTDQTKVRDEERKTTCLDIQLILPTVLILILTLVFMSTVIPYAFHVVIQQLKEHHGSEDNGGAVLTVELADERKIILLLGCNQ